MLSFRHLEPAGGTLSTQRAKGDAMRTTWLAVVVAVALAGECAVGQDVEIPKGPCGTKPPAQQQRRKGGEGVPPLPLPATPLRRTERKRPPSPPVLIAKIAYGAPKEITVADQAVKYLDWDKDPGDVQVLVGLANQALNLNYTTRKGTMKEFAPDPAQYPIYHFSGSDDFKLTDAEIDRLRDFIRAGGTLWGDTVYGDPDFFKAFIREMGKVFPDRHFYQVPLDHPLLNCYYQIKKVTYTRDPPDAPNGEPMLFAMDVGCRAAVVLSRYGLCCGWDGHRRAKAFNVDVEDARKIGINMIAYALGTHGVGIYQATAKNYYEEDARARGDFIFAQARVGENWDSQANNLANLLKAVATKTSTEIKFERKIVDLASPDVLGYPFLYVTGHQDFKLSNAEVQGLKTYLAGGGFILASPCCGRREFDTAFRREIARVTSAPLQPLAENHPVYNIMYKLKSVSYSPYAEAQQESLPKLPIEGVTVGGSTSVVYCPIGLGGGWRGFDHPYGRDIATDDATKLGVNVVMYSLTH